MSGATNKPDEAILPSEASLTNDTLVTGDTNLADEAWVIVPDEATPQSPTSLASTTSADDQAISPSDSISSGVVTMIAQTTLSDENTTMPSGTTQSDGATQANKKIKNTKPNATTPANITVQPSNINTQMPAAKGTFPLFPSLPREIRAQIWELCLPRRFIPLSTLVVGRDHRNAAAETDPTQPGCDDPAVQTLIDSVMTRACRIAQVCRESRAVALSQRESTAELGLLWLGRENWFDRRTDMLFVDCDVRERYREIWEELRAKVVVGDWEEQGYGAGGAGGVCVALCKHMVMRWTPTDPPAPVLPVMETGVTTRRGIRQKSWPVVRERLPPIPGQKSPAGSGKFGLFDEECVTLLDVSEGKQGGVVEWVKELLSETFCMELSL
ncbi:predicted protein [Chaetomium globosum CBS 148.51]|uniref:2EXR domain-containing protein n=1 Tax=Chaetomium globosum (strain ATCC 6205 / CBS 148.51 / DSM 1962 / NBRC 6347 / NRRL 1970) TaxID=306901 RepID=Q2GQ98_CHAGB|nr:uncharacterized protein CHGG_09856 [Chaetomium globosum CBS 148.51]EAQ83452.1 predicted protein [Chaetomium globosum CBS 148.51]